MTNGKSSTATGLSYLRVQENLERLKMTLTLSALDRLAEEASKEEWSYAVMGRQFANLIPAEVGNFKPPQMGKIKPPLTFGSNC